MGQVGLDRAHPLARLFGALALAESTIVPFLNQLSLGIHNRMSDAMNVLHAAIGSHHSELGVARHSFANVFHLYSESCT